MMIYTVEEDGCMSYSGEIYFLIEFVQMLPQIELPKWLITPQNA